MDRDATRQRTKADMETDFLPEASPDTLSQADRRMVNAAEYIAYHLGQMDKKLDRLIVLLEASIRCTSIHSRPLKPASTQATTLTVLAERPWTPVTCPDVWPPGWRLLWLVRPQCA